MTAVHQVTFYDLLTLLAQSTNNFFLTKIIKNFNFKILIQNRKSTDTVINNAIIA